MASASVALMVRVAPSGRAISSGVSNMSTAMISAAPARLSTATTSSADRPAADDQHALAGHIAGARDGVPGDGGGLDERGVAQRERLGQRAACAPGSAT